MSPVITRSEQRIAEFEIPSHEIFRKVFVQTPSGALASPVPPLPPDIRFLLKAVEEYHNFDKRHSAFVWPRIHKLREVELHLKRIKQLHEILLYRHGINLHQDPMYADILLLTESVTKRKNYLCKLSDYLMPDKCDTITELVNMFSQQPIVNVVYIKESYRHPRHVSLHQKKILEKYEPRHRGGYEWMEELFLAYVQDQVNRQKNPAEKLVDFFLEIEHETIYRVAKPVPYWTKEEAAWREIWFEAGRAFTYYVMLSETVTQFGEAPYTRYTRYFYVQYDPAHHAQYIPHVYPLHSLKTGQVILSSGQTITVKYGYKWPDRGSKDPDLRESYIYVMRKGQIFAYPPAQQTSKGAPFHSFGFQGKKIQAGGLLVAVDGQIVAIDNRSGHYRPSILHLKQAVSLIESHGAFYHDALVGVAYSYKVHVPGTGRGDEGFEEVGNSAFFPVNIFLGLARNNFRLMDVWNAFGVMERKYPNGPASFPQHGQEVWGLFTRRWTAHNLTWDRVKRDFINYLYPGLKRYMATINQILESRTIPAPSRFMRDTTWAFHRRGGLETIDEALRAYDAHYDTLRRAVTTDNMYLINFTLKTLKTTLVTIFTEASEWLGWATSPEGRTSTARRRAVENLFRAAEEQYRNIETAVVDLNKMRRNYIEISRPPSHT